MLTEKVGNLGLRSVRNNRCRASKKWARKAKMAEALAGYSVGGWSSDPAGDRYIWDPGQREGKTWTR